MAERLLEVTDLSTHFFTYAGEVKAVNGVSFTLDRDETLGIVGESGSGKTVTAMSVMRLIPDPPGRVDDRSDGHRVEHGPVRRIRHLPRWVRAGGLPDQGRASSRLGDGCG